MSSKSNNNARDIRRASNREIFDYWSSTWRLSGTAATYSFNFATCHDYMSPLLVESLRTVTAFGVSVEHIATIYNRFSSVKRILRAASEYEGGPISSLSIKTGRAILLSGKLASILGAFHLLRSWELFNLPGLEPGVSELFANIIPDRSNQSHILTLDPTTGPFLPEEIEIVERRLSSAFELSEINCCQYSLVQIFRLFGQRPASVANIKLGDVKLPASMSEPAGIRFEILKQGSDTARSHGPWRPIPNLLRIALSTYVATLTDGSQTTDWNLDAPLFPALSDTQFYQRDFAPITVGSRREGQIASKYRDHSTSSMLSKRYKSTLESLSIVSPRTGEPMAFTPTRERHTIATIMAMRGCPAHEIAAWLHHTTDESCEAYIELAWQHHQLMSSLLDGRMTHVADRFLGRLVAERNDDTLPTAIIVASELDDAPEIGDCSTGGCSAIESLAAPYSCFLCRFFHLSIDAKLDRLLELLRMRKLEADKWGEDEFSRMVNQHIAAIVAAAWQQSEAKSKRLNPA